MSLLLTLNYKIKLDKNYVMISSQYTVETGLNGLFITVTSNKNVQSAFKTQLFHFFFLDIYKTLRMTISFKFQQNPIACSRKNTVVQRNIHVTMAHPMSYSLKKHSKTSIFFLMEHRLTLQ